MPPGFSETAVWSGQPGGCGNPATANAWQLLSTGGELHAAVLHDQRRCVQQDEPRASLFPITPATIAPASGTRFRAGALGQRRLADARSFDRGIASSRADGCDKSDRYRFQDHCGRRQSTAGRSEGAKRSVHGRRQGLRRDDQWAGDVRHNDRAVRVTLWLSSTAS